MENSFISPACLNRLLYIQPANDTTGIHFSGRHHPRRNETQRRISVQRDQPAARQRGEGETELEGDLQSGGGGYARAFGRHGRGERDSMQLPLPYKTIAGCGRSYLEILDALRTR